MKSMSIVNNHGRFSIRVHFHTEAAAPQDAGMSTHMTAKTLYSSFLTPYSSFSCRIITV